ncbi:MAG: hypothetical protein HFH12_00785 [Dorea sp.]|nr:hypothetical protein [Dorea sp.]
MNYIGTIEHDRHLGDAAQIVIYGAGKVGKETWEFLRKKGWKEKVVCFCDNNTDAQGKELQGLPVFSLSEACSRYPQGTYLIASLCVRQMLESLLGYGIETIHIIREH